MGALVLEEKIDEYETLGDLLARLASGDSEAWAVLFDLQTRQMARHVVIIFNGRALAASQGL